MKVLGYRDASCLKTADLVELLPVEELTVEVGRGEGAREVHAVGVAAPKRVVLLHPDGVAPLGVKGAGEPAPGPAAVGRLVDGRVRDVVVDKLAQLHHHHRVLRVQPVVAAGQPVADPAARRQFKIVRGPLARHVEAAGAVVGQEDSLVGRAGATVVWLPEVVADAGVGAKPLVGVAGRGRQPRAVAAHRPAREDVEAGPEADDAGGGPRTAGRLVDPLGHLEEDGGGAVQLLGLPPRLVELVVEEGRLSK